MPDFNTGTVVLNFTDSRARHISGDFELRFRNLKLQSFDFKKKIQLQGMPMALKEVPAFPIGNWNIEVFPTKYRFKSVFVSVPSNGEVEVVEAFFVDPGKVTPQFPSADQLQNEENWAALSSVLTESPIAYASLNNPQKAGLLNLYAKMKDETANDVFDQVINIFEVKPARIYAEVRQELWEMVRASPDRFHEEPDNGSMHDFGNGWTRLDEHASFKTPDPMGNLQLTFATNNQGRMAVDADLDDHQGLKHAFDVIKHKFSGDTNPYDIHEVLLKFQGIDPGYDFA